MKRPTQGTAGKTPRSPRRTDALTRDVIVQAATSLLDEGGETALTLRALTEHLHTGYGAIYHHVADRSDLLAAATDGVIAGVLAGADTDAGPREALRRLALRLFDAIDAHPWIGAELSRQPWRPALLEFYESIGRLLNALAVPERARFDAAGVLVNYILGVAGQNAANARRLAGRDAGREAFLATIARQWEQVDPGRYPFVHEAATRLSEHDDRDQFLAGVDILLAGIATLR